MASSLRAETLPAQRDVPPMPAEAPSVEPAETAWAGPAEPAAERRVPWYRSWWPYAIAAVPLSSLLGLLSTMVGEGPRAFADFWAASLWADLLFMAGIAGAVWLGFRITWGKGRPSGLRFAGGALAALAVAYGTYLVCASLAVGAMRSGAGFFAARLVLDDAPLTVFLRGLPGLAVAAFAGPLLALFLPAGPARDGPALQATPK